MCLWLKKKMLHCIIYKAQEMLTNTTLALQMDST